MPTFPNTPSWRGAQLKQRDKSISNKLNVIIDSGLVEIIIHICITKGHD